MTEDLASFPSGGEPYLLALANDEAGAGHRAFMSAVRGFSMRFLPSRGWLRVLEAGPGAGTRALLLAERGYDVTLFGGDELERRFVEHRLAGRGLRATFVDELARATFDAAFCYDPSALGLDAAGAADALQGTLHRRGLLIGGPAFRRLARYRDVGADFPALRRRWWR